MSERSVKYSQNVSDISCHNSTQPQQRNNKQNKQQTYYVILPDKQITELQLMRPKKLLGAIILHNICSTHEIKETDSFGLQYVGQEGEYLWLNLKNKIFEEIGKKPAKKRAPEFYRFYFRIKFYLHPQMVFTRGAKEIYYGEVRAKYLCGGFDLTLQEQISVSSLMAQTEMGPAHLYEREVSYGEVIPDNLKEGSETLFVACVRHKHKLIKELNRQVCIQRLLAVLSDNKEYGIQWYHGLHILTLAEGEETTQQTPVDMGIGPEYVYMCSPSGDELYSFHIGLVENLQRTNKGYCVIQLKAEDTGDVTGRSLHVGGVTPFISIALFRALAERATFYLSDQVIDQIKNEVPAVQCQSWTQSEAKIAVYTYDLLRNMKQSYSCLLAELSEPRVKLLRGLPTPADSSGTLLGSQCKLCYDGFISVVFKECGHAVTCSNCLFKLSNCPVCRSEVKLSQLTPLITPLQ